MTEDRAKYETGATVDDQSEDVILRAMIDEFKRQDAFVLVDDPDWALIDGRVDLTKVADAVRAATSKAADAWRAWVADERNSPMYDTDMGDLACALCGASEFFPHDADCPYKMMRDELNETPAGHSAGERK